MAWRARPSLGPRPPPPAATDLCCGESVLALDDQGELNGYAVLQRAVGHGQVASSAAAPIVPPRFQGIAARARVSRAWHFGSGGGRHCGRAGRRASVQVHGLERRQVGARDRVRFQRRRIVTVPRACAVAHLLVGWRRVRVVRVRCCAPPPVTHRRAPPPPGPPRQSMRRPTAAPPRAAG